VLFTIVRQKTHLAKQLTKVYGRSFSERNIWHIGRFYQTWGNMNALRSGLTWTHRECPQMEQEKKMLL